MTEDQVKKAKTLLDQRGNFEKALKGKMVRDVVTNERWNAGSAVHPEKMAMVEAIKSCESVCEAILRLEAKKVLEDIDRQLKELGVGDESCMGPTKDIADEMRYWFNQSDTGGIFTSAVAAWPAVMIEGRPYKGVSVDEIVGMPLSFNNTIGSAVSFEVKEKTGVGIRRITARCLYEDGTTNAYLVDFKNNEAWPMPEGWVK